MANERVPQFSFAARPPRRRFLEALRTREPRVQALGLQYTAVWPKSRPPVSSMVASVLLHASLISLLIRVPYLVRLVTSTHPRPSANQARQTVYVLRQLSLSEYFPVVRPPGPGGKPDQGSQKDLQPPVGTKAVDSRGLIVSAPPNPDNFRQTIVQPASPPELRIPTELKLPNVVTGNFAPPPPPEIKPEVKIPSQTVMDNLTASLNNSHQVALTPALSLKLPPLETPHLEVPLPSAPAVPQPSNDHGTAGVQTAPSAQQTNLTDLGIRGNRPSDAKALFSLSVDPGPAAQLIELPPGNRFGAFTIGAVGGLGSPGGVAGGVAGGGVAGSGPGGDSSSGLGPGGSGGGGNGGGGTGTVSVNGNGLTGAREGGAISALTAASMVYPVPSTSRPRQSRMLVTSGPGGGGGLSVYGVLRGKRIYTIYLPMPGKNWILQYCESRAAAPDEGVEHSRMVAIRLDPGLVPPSVEEQFDFHRPALPRKQTDEMIVLHGFIRDDGSVAEVKILKGLEAFSDEAAIAAFVRWKFKPALRAGNAVAIEVLVGIPAM
jgi:hypothetical protein